MEAVGGPGGDEGGRAVEDELPAPPGGAMRRALCRLEPSSLVPVIFSRNSFR